MDVPPPPDLEELYDRRVLARIDQRGPDGRTGHDPAVSGGRGDGHRDEGLPGPGGADLIGTADADLIGTADAGIDAGDGDGGGDGGDLGVLADDDEGWGSSRPAPAVVRRFGIVGAVAAGALLGLADVLEPDRARQHVIEFAPDRLDESGQLVTYHHVPGDPRASRIVVRPWLRGEYRRAGA